MVSLLSWKDFKKYRKLNGEFTFIERWKIKVKLKRFLFRTYAWCCGHSRKVCILYLQYILGFFHLRISTIIHTCIRADYIDLFSITIFHQPTKPILPLQFTPHSKLPSLPPAKKKPLQTITKTTTKMTNSQTK